MRAGLAVGLNIGDVVTFSATDAIGMDGTRGVAGVACRVARIERDRVRGRATLDLITWDANGTGWVPSLRVSSVLGANQIRCFANYYASTEHRLTGAAQTDVGCFAGNDPVECIPAGSWAGRVTTTITAIVGNDVTFAVAHGLAGGDAVDFGIYQVAHRTITLGYAFLADAADLLGAQNDRAKEYV